MKYQGTSTLFDVAYTSFDMVGNRKTRVQDGVTANFAYDLVYRLLTVTAPTSETYQYDNVGNMTMGPLATQTNYSYDAANQQLTNPIWTATFDTNGELNTAGIWTYGWNPAGQLIKSTGNVREVTYKYDPFGRRIERNWREYNSYNWDFTYLYDGDDVVMSWKKDVNTGGTLETNHYIHGPGVDEHLAMTRSGVPYFYLADGNNNIIKVVNQNQSIAQTYTFDSYGVYTNGLTFDQPYQMAGREFDRETYFYYDRARYYSPRAKRFISRDPIGFAGGDAVSYGYTGGNPVNWIDPSGQTPAAVIGAVAGAAYGLISTGFGDLLANVASPTGHFSSIGTYVGNIVGGAVTGAMVSMNPIGAAAVGSLVGTPLQFAIDREVDLKGGFLNLGGGVMGAGVGLIAKPLKPISMLSNELGSVFSNRAVNNLWGMGAWGAFGQLPSMMYNNFLGRKNPCER